MKLTSPKKAKKFFEAKMNFTTGPVELNEMIKNNDNINIVDVRASEDYAQGHIPGAINLPKQRWSSRSGLRSDKINVIYCYSEVCHLAVAAAKEFAEHGFAVMELEGGFEQWKHYNMSVET
jgi:rhodanese-related sulfurtransferase